jgi:hypothetical protein
VRRRVSSKVPLVDGDTTFGDHSTVGVELRRQSWRLIIGSGWRPSASPCDAFEYPARERHLRRAPHVSLLEGPGVDRIAVAHQLEQAWLAELRG